MVTEFLTNYLKQNMINEISSFTTRNIAVHIAQNEIFLSTYIIYFSVFIFQTNFAKECCMVDCN